jgi:hypothetical protein
MTDALFSSNTGPISKTVPFEPERSENTKNPEKIIHTDSQNGGRQTVLRSLVLP